MNEDGVRVTRIDWLTAIPSLRLLEAIPMAVSLCIFVPVLLLMLLAWGTTQLAGEKFSQLQRTDPVRSLVNLSDCELPEYLDMIDESLTRVAQGSPSQSALGVVTLGWWMLMLGFCGVAAIRSAGCRFCTGTRCGVTASVRLALQSWKSILISTLLSGMLLGLLCVAFWILRWAGTKTHVSITAAALLMYIIGCLVLGFGWLLSIAAIAIDRCDGPEALSRGINYVLSRWVRVVVYVTVCCLMMAICNRAVLWLSDQAHALASSKYGNPDPVLRGEFGISLGSTLGSFGELLRLSIFLCEIAIAYVLLRNVEDGVSLREIDGGRVIKTSDRLVGSD